MNRLGLILVLTAGMATELWAEGERDTQVRNDKTDYGASQAWIYNNLNAGFIEAKKSARPMMVVFR